MARPLTGALAGVFVAGASLAPIRAQTTEDILAPAGHIRFDVTSTFHLWERRFGLREENGALIEESEPVGFDLEQQPLISLDTLTSRLRSAASDPSLELVLGSARAEVAHERTEVKFGVALGLFDWLTIALAVPLVETRTEPTFDFRALDDANLGFSPSAAGIDAFRTSIATSIAQLRARRDETCPTGPECGALTDLIARYEPFGRTLDSAYDSPVFVVAGTRASDALQARLAGFRAEAEPYAPGAIPDSVPVASKRLDEAELMYILTTHPSGPRVIAPFSRSRTPLQLGDVELGAAFRLIEGAVRDSAPASIRLRYRLGGRVLVRLATGSTDHPDVPLDLGRGDGSLDVEAAAFADIRVARVGVQAEIRRGFPQATTRLRRVAPPDRVLAPGPARQVRWTPGAFWRLELVPRWHLTNELALGVLYRTVGKGADDYEDLTGPPTGSYPAGVLEVETEGSVSELGLGLAISTVARWREDQAPVPLELRAAVRKAVRGSGGATPDGLRFEANGQVFVRLWGSR